MGGTIKMRTLLFWVLFLLVPIATAVPANSQVDKDKFTKIVIDKRGPMWALKSRDIDPRLWTLLVFENGRRVRPGQARQLPDKLYLATKLIKTDLSKKLTRRYRFYMRAEKKESKEFYGSKFN
jgi:hypothetical protein